MSEKKEKHATVNEKAAEQTSHGATRREMFQIGNVLALPALLGGLEAKAAQGPPANADLPVHRRRTRHQLSRHFHL
jgi:hypothetical protein